MNQKQLQDLANIMRREVINMTSAAGSGHPTSCLSCAEIMSVLFFEQMSYNVKNPEDMDNDEFILSKGHAAPILYSALYHTGCIKTNLMKLRKLDSELQGHPVPNSIKWIKIATGSLGQGLSAGLGMALAAKLQNRNFKTYVLLGDSEIAEGSIYEACEIASQYKLNNLIAIVDVNRLGQRGETMLGHDLKSYKKRFKGFGWNAVIINGHNINQIIKALKNLNNAKKPTIILAKTFKGKGVSFLKNKEDWHGRTLDNEQLKQALNEIPNHIIPKVIIKKPISSNSKIIRKERLESTNYNISKMVSTRDAYGNTLASLAKSDSKIIVVDAEVSNSTKSEKVKNQTPEQFIEAYIAEQNMVGMALGLSKKGFNVFASSFSAFLSRAHDQLRMTSLSNPKTLTLCGSHSGVSVGEDGASQMGLEDIAMFRSLPKSIVFSPSDAVSTEKLTILSSKLKGLKYIRTTRPEIPVLYKKNESFSLGNFKILKNSKNDKAIIIGTGITVHEALKAYEELKKQKIHTSIVDIYCIKPFNSKKFINFVKTHGKKLVIVEDHYSEGGIGEMLAEVLENHNVKIKNLAIKEIPRSGTKEQLMKIYGIDSTSIIKEVKKLI